MKWLPLLLVLIAAPVFAGPIPSKYDLHFNKWAGLYMPGVDWQLLKAQCWQESRFNEKAVSPVGAMGLCQFMPGTWSDVRLGLKLTPEASAFAPDLSIQAAAFFMGRMRSIWKAPRPEFDRHSLALACYNAGPGHILRAQKLANNSPLWPPVARLLPRVTGSHSGETITYVERIWQYYKQLLVS